MKTFDIDENGGMPAYLNDLRFMESVHKDAFEALLKPFSDLYDVIILSGCERSVSSGDVTITAGFILYQGIIMRVEEQTYPEPTTDSEYWITNTLTLNGGNKTYFDGNIHDTWKEDVGLIEVGSSVPPNSLTIQDTPTYYEVTTEFLVNPEWQPLPESSNVFPSNGPAARFLKDNSGMVHLSGFFTDDDPVLGQNIGRLPEGYRPAETVRHIHVDRGVDSLSGTFHRYDIQTDGYIKAIDGPGQSVNLNNWPIFKAVEV